MRNPLELPCRRITNKIYIACIRATISAQRSNPHNGMLSMFGHLGLPRMLYSKEVAHYKTVLSSF